MAGQGRGSGTPLPPQLRTPAPRHSCQRRAQADPPFPVPAALAASRTRAPAPPPAHGQRKGGVAAAGLRRGFRARNVGRWSRAVKTTLSCPARSGAARKLRVCGS